MTNQIGTIPIGSIQEISFSDGTSFDEIDILSEDSNIILSGEDEITDIEISVILTEDIHPDDFSVEEQRKELKELPKNPLQENSFIDLGRRGYISVENVDVSESSDIPTVREGVIEGKFMSWPKQFPDDRPAFFIFVKGDIQGDFNATGDLFLLAPLEGSFDGNFNSEAELNRITSLDGDLDGRFRTTSTGYGVDYGSDYGEGQRPILSLFTSLDVNSDFSFHSNGNVSSIKSLDVDFDGRFDLTADLEFRGYGTSYSSNYGG